MLSNVVFQSCLRVFSLIIGNSPIIVLKHYRFIKTGDFYNRNLFAYELIGVDGAG